MSLSRIQGTLLYAIDKENNQLILSLQDDIEENLKIEFRNQETIVSLSELCGCIACRYRPINMHLKIDKVITMYCNGRVVKTIKFGNKKSMNNGYPVLGSRHDAEVAIWLVNTPRHGDVYPNNEQLFGCIFAVSYNTEQLAMAKVGLGIGDNCNSTCNHNVCNGGTCHEPYYGRPVCDCSGTFANGDNCDKAPKKMTKNNVVYTDRNLKLKNLKLTWNSGSSKILQMNTKRTSIWIYVDNENKLILKYQNTMNEFTITAEGLIFGEYKAKENNTLILTFEEKFIKYQIRNNTSQKFPINSDLDKEQFILIRLLNDIGVGDLAYKNDVREFKWNSIQWKTANKILNNKSHDSSIYFDLPKDLTFKLLLNENSDRDGREWESSSIESKIFNKSAANTGNPEWKWYVIAVLLVTLAISFIFIVLIRIEICCPENRKMERETKLIIIKENV